MRNFTSTWEAILTGDNASTTVSISEGTTGVDAELSFRESTIDAVLSIIKLADSAGSTAGCS
jgi:O-glycosyl hydrolase